MNTLFLHFNDNGTVKTASVRIDGKKVPDMTIWEAWSFYQLLLQTGHKPIEMNDPDGNLIHMLIY